MIYESLFFALSWKYFHKKEIWANLSLVPRGSESLIVYFCAGPYMHPIPKSAAADIVSSGRPRTTEKASKTCDDTRFTRLQQPQLQQLQQLYHSIPVPFPDISTERYFSALRTTISFQIYPTKEEEEDSHIY